MGGRRKKIGEDRILLCIVLLGVGLRLAYLVHLSPVCRADEAVFGLMTKHLIEGKGFPIYLYGAHYAGALICYLAAIPFLLFGMSMPLLKLITCLFSLPTIVFTYLLARSLMGKRVAILAALLMAAPPFLILWTGQYAGGGYPETLFFGTICLFLTHQLLSQKRSPPEEVRQMALLGFLNGIGTWILFSMIPYTLTTWTLLAYQKLRTPFRKLLVIFLVFYAIGISPLVIYNIQHPLATFKRLGANVLEVEGSEVSGKGLEDLFRLGLSKTSSKIMGLPKAILQVVQNVWEMVRMDASLGRVSRMWDLLLALALLLVGSFVVKDLFFQRGPGFFKKPLSLPVVLVGWMVLFLAVAGLTKTRYISFLYPAWAILSAWSILQLASRRWLSISLATLFLSSNLVNDLVALKTPESEDRFGELVSFLETRGFRYGYSDYVTAYPVAFLTDESVMLSPIAGPLNVERIPSYTERVNRAEKVFFVFEKETEAARRFEEILRLRRVTYRKKDVTTHSVYYDFSERIYPDDLPLLRQFPSP